MVVAGVFLVARMFPVYILEASATTFVAIIGAATAFYAAVVACTQLDIRALNMACVNKWNIEAM